MEVTLSKQCLATALAKTSGISDRKSSMQILSNVLIDADGPKHVRVAATDLNLSASGLFPAEVVSGGAVTLPAKTLYDVVRSMPEGPISLATEGEAVLVSSGQADRGSATELLEAGARGFLPKPYTRERLAAAVDAALAQDRKTN